MIEKLDQFEFHHVLEETPGNSIVLFTAPHCGSCRAMKLALGQVLAEERGWHVFEVDAERDLALVREFDVFHLPALFLYRDGAFHAPLQVSPVPADIILAVNQLASQEPAEAP
jgi:thiol-disulfide isomerase/thioredoxin